MLSRTSRFLLWAAAALFAAALTIAWTPVLAADTEARAAESPYFAVQSNEPGVDALPLKGSQVEVQIAGVIAEVRLTQTYRNEGSRAIEARYIFPGSTRSAVHAMTVRLGERTIVAQVREKQRARLEYQNAKREGKTSALLEQERPNVFSMNVAPILPGDEVQVELRYSELIAPDEGVYRFVFPTVVGPRYRSPAAEAGNGALSPTAHLAPGTAPRTRFDLSLSLVAPLPVTELRSPSHKIETVGLGNRKVSVTLVGEDTRDNRDFILDYRLAGERTATGLMLHRDPDGGENFFLALVEPPQQVAPLQINPRDYIFVVDISGSMHGYPLRTAKVLLRELIGSLRPSDSFNVMLFSGSSRMLADASVPATQANIARALQIIDRAGGGGSTEIVPALKRVAALPRTAELARTVIVVTDGFVAVENEVFQLVRRHLSQFNLFAFGIGSSVNRHLIEGLARAGQGEAFVVTQPEQAAQQAERLRRMIEAPVLTQLKAQLIGLDAYDVEPAALPDVLTGRPVLMWGKWRGDAGAAKLVLRGQRAGGEHVEVIDAPAPDPSAAALQHLWARQRIAQLADEEALQGGQAQRDAITALGLRYGLLTQYTSFVAVDQIARNREAALPVDQPLPLPQGVSALAVGGTAQPGVVLSAAVPSTPEPAPGAALAVVLAVGAALLLRVRRRAACEVRKEFP